MIQAGLRGNGRMEGGDVVMYLFLLKDGQD